MTDACIQDVECQKKIKMKINLGKEPENVVNIYGTVMYVYFV